MKPIIQFEDTEKQDGHLYTVKEVEKSKELKTVDNGLSIYQEKANTLTVIDEQSYTDAADFCKDIKIANKKIEEKRKFFGTPYADAKKAIDSIFKEKISALSQIEKTIKNKMLTYHNKQEEIARKEREKIEEQNRRKMEKAVAKQEANPDKIVAPPILKSTNVKVDQTVKGDNATSTVKKIKKWKLVDINQIPREYMCIDEKKINAVVKAGVEIPGIQIYEEASLAIR